MSNNLFGVWQKYAKLLCGISALLAVSNSFAADENLDTLNVAHPVAAEAEENTDSVYFVADKMPEFPGGTTAMGEYVYENIQYPKDALLDGRQAVVMVEFVVEKDGSLSSMYILNKVSPVFAKEALRVIKSMPKWTPGVRKGKPARMRYCIPVVFQITNDILKAFGYERVDTSENPSAEEPEPVYQVVERMPEFQGGMEALMKFLSRNLKYPSAALDAGIQGRVLVSFTVDTDGSVINPTIMKSVHPVLDLEAIRVALSMPKWNAGMQKGKTVKVKYTVPVAFRIQ
ncbi:MAG: energy transducer TonB [Bacteroides sp.]|nr:energy transducer TonB [Roseburia sp.]MCM1345734.1 energy transducer TonB [Bacteroides sp.]MCM1419835.1 energy transducer TonB [Bacteroides sp.]